jgi:hypothetical protein
MLIHRRLRYREIWHSHRASISEREPEYGCRFGNSEIQLPRQDGVALPQPSTGSPQDMVTCSHTPIEVSGMSTVPSTGIDLTSITSASTPRWLMKSGRAELWLDVATRNLKRIKQNWVCLVRKLLGKRIPTRRGRTTPKLRNLASISEELHIRADGDHS